MLRSAEELLRACMWAGVGRDVTLAGGGQVCEELLGRAHADAALLTYSAWAAHALAHANGHDDVAQWLQQR